MDEVKSSFIDDYDLPEEVKQYIFNESKKVLGSFSEELSIFEVSVLMTCFIITIANAYKMTPENMKKTLERTYRDYCILMRSEENQEKNEKT